MVLEPFMDFVDELTGKRVPRCQHISEAHPTQCLAVDSPIHHLHTFTDCSFCAYTYDPCPYHEPTAHAAHDERDRAARARFMAARDELRERKGELPEWAQRAIEIVL